MKSWFLCLIKAARYCIAAKIPVGATIKKVEYNSFSSRAPY